MRPQSESQIQHGCIAWFRTQYPFLSRLLFAVPNGGKRDRRTGAQMKYEGCMRGVADLILLVPKKGYASLCIEMKTPKGVQSDEQRIWQRSAEKANNKYVVCRSLEEFMNEVNSYLR
ncbi:MAG: nuclease [Bacteroidetes bacterium]|nr:nuclease [Bacteroidota bacterium]